MFRLVTAVILASAALGLPAGAQAPSIQQGAGHRFACADYVQGKVLIVSAEGAVEWEAPAPACDDIWVLPNGNRLFVTGHGVRELDPSGAVVFEYASTSEVYACQRLADGNTFIGECNAGRLLEVAPTGEIVKEIRLLPEGVDGGHLFMRNARRLADGHYLVCLMGEQRVVEYDTEGRPVWEVAAPGGPHTAVRLPDGNTLISVGDLAPDSAKVFEVNTAGETVWQVTSADLSGISLQFMTGLHRLPNGNTVLSNWLGHGHFGEAPHVIEVTRNKEVVWTFSDHDTMKTIASVQVLDVAGDALAGTVLH